MSKKHKLFGGIALGILVITAIILGNSTLFTGTFQINRNTFLQKQDSLLKEQQSKTIQENFRQLGNIPVKSKTEIATEVGDKNKFSLDRLQRLFRDQNVGIDNRYFVASTEFETCAPGLDPLLCHEETNEQIFYDETDVTLDTITNIGDIQICLQGTSANTEPVQLNQLKFETIASGYYLMQATIDEQTINRAAAYSETITFDFSSEEVFMNTGECKTVNFTVRPDRTNIGTNLNINHYFGAKLETITTNQNIPFVNRAATPIYLFNTNRIMPEYFTNYNVVNIQQDVPTFFGYNRICTWPASTTTITAISYQIVDQNNQNLTLPLNLTTISDTNVYFDELHYIYDYSDEPITSTNGQITINNEVIGYNECKAFGFSIDSADIPESVEEINFTLTSIEFTNHDNMAFTDANDNWTTVQDALPIPISKLIYSENIPIGIIDSGDDKKFTKKGEFTDCIIDRPASQIANCNLYTAYNYYSGINFLLEEQRLKLQDISYAINSQNLENFTITAQLKNEQGDTITSQEVLIQPGINEFTLENNATVLADQVNQIVFAPVNNLEKITDNFFSNGSLQIAITDLTHVLIDDETTTEIPSRIAYDGDLLPAPQIEQIITVDDPKLILTEENYPPIETISLSSLQPDSISTIDAARFEINNLRGGLFISEVTFSHNINKESIPADLLELEIGNQSLIPTEWVQNESVTFRFLEPVYIWPETNNYGWLKLINPNAEILQNNTPTPVAFELTSMKLHTKEEDVYIEELREPVTQLATGFNGINPVFLDEQSLNGKIMIFTP